MTTGDIGKNTTVAVDLMGGDYSPDAVIKGCVMALRKGTAILALGDSSAIAKLRAQSKSPNLTTLECSQVIGLDDPPVSSIRHKRDSTIVKGLSAVKNGDAGAFVSAGSTGALVAGGVLVLRRAQGVDRPCLGVLLPSQDKKGVFFVDLGASSDVRPEVLVEFGLMGKVYVESVLGRREPRVGLLNIGTEKEKGNAVAKRAYKLMEKAPLNFVGNIEARDVFFGKADVIVTDGFTGNVFLKTCEGTASFQLQTINEQIQSNLKFKVGALLIKSALRRAKRILDYSAYGGAPMLGLQGCLIKCHGSSGPVAVANGIDQALKFLSKGVASIISRTLSKDCGESES